MSKAGATRQYIIKRTAPIFSKRGGAGTSLSDITDATGLSKGSIYGNFESKAEVALAVYKYNVGKLLNNKEAWMKVEKDAYARLIAFVDFYRKNWGQIFETGGCPILNPADESDDTLPVVKANVRMTFKNRNKNITKIIQDGIAKKSSISK